MLIEGLWNLEGNGPDPEAFKSTVPFCLDTMSFENWLQYVLLKKLALMMIRSLVDPKAEEEIRAMNVRVHPAAEEYWRGQWQEHRHVLLALRHLDEVFEDQAH